MNSLRSGQHRAERRAQALGEVQPNRVAVRDDVLGRDAQGHGGVQHAGAVHVDLHAVLVGDIGDGLQFGDLPAGAAALVGGLLDLDQTLRRRVAADGADRGLQRFGGEDAARALQAADHHAGDRAGAAGLAGLDVGVLVRQDLVAGTAMRGERDLIAHRAGGHEHRRLLAQQRRGPVAQLPYRRIGPALLVAHFGRHHRLLHARATAWSGCPNRG